MRKPRVLAIGLDGYETSLGEAMMAQGELPALARLRERSARVLLDHGAATRTGLAWEHFSTARSPAAANRWSAVGFDPLTYDVWHEGTSLDPFARTFASRTLVFDVPYFDLDRAPSAVGVVNWGAHDPGIAAGSRPDGLDVEMLERFGPYPAADWIYGIVWPSPERTREMADALARAVDMRREASLWLLGRRCPDWDLAMVVAGEPHSAIEALWHGVDPTHPLHALPSARPAGDGLRQIYRALDRMVGELTEAFPDANVIAFSMNGMGPNRSDVASMVLLPELFYRHAFNEPRLKLPDAWRMPGVTAPGVDAGEDWHHAVNSCLPAPLAPRWLARRAVSRFIPGFVRHALKLRSRGRELLRMPLDWMPAYRYQAFWKRMPFFAMPSFYDGRVRINLCGREANGLVPAADYGSTCDAVEELVRSCRDLATGEPVVAEIERCGGSDPVRLGPSACDMVVVWRGAALGFEHPKLGHIGPVPYRRTGGHTGPYGMAYLAGADIVANDLGVRSSFDVAPTIAELLGERLASGSSGSSFLSLARARAAAASHAR